MSDTLIKANNITYGDKKKRVIDSNQAISDRLAFLNEIMNSSPDGSYDDSYGEEFTEGIGAERIDALFDDQDDTYYEGDNGEASGLSQEQYDEIINQANAQADDIIAGANQEAERIVESARTEAENIKQQAYEEGAASGSEAGYQDGLARANAYEEELRQQEAFLQQEYEKNATMLESLLVEKLTDVYSHVFGIDLSGRNDVVLHLLQNAVRGIEGTQSYFVHVSKEDYEYVLSNKDELSAGLASTCVVEVIEDMTLTAGKCFIEADSGIFDCSIGTQLSNLQKELRILSYNPS